MVFPRTGSPNWSVKVAVTVFPAPRPSSDAIANSDRVDNVRARGTGASSDQVKVLEVKAAPSLSCNGKSVGAPLNVNVTIAVSPVLVLGSVWVNSKTILPDPSVVIALVEVVRLSPITVCRATVIRLPLSATALSSSSAI